jgi:hypothetical protein
VIHRKVPGQPLVLDVGDDTRTFFDINTISQFSAKGMGIHRRLDGGANIVEESACISRSSNVRISLGKY